MRKFSTVEAREHFADIINHASYQHERTIITKHGKNVAALVPMEDLEILDMISRILDIQAAKEALTEQGELTSLSDIKKELGIS